ncbi:MAG: class I SAM-dependent methyltransferase [Thermoplasmatota archaeon]
MPGVQKGIIQTSQAGWLRDWHRYLINTYCGECRDALEIGCGEGRVMENISDIIRVKGIDIDGDQIQRAASRGFDAVVMDGLSTGFENWSFDLVYCSFYLMWSGDIIKALEEMMRIGRSKVLIMSEPIWSQSIVKPAELQQIVDGVMAELGKDRGDPDAGLEVVGVLKDLGADFRFGFVPNDTSPVETEKNVDIELDFLDDRGIHIDVDRIDIFHIPFIWAVVDL